MTGAGRVPGLTVAVIARNAGALIGGCLGTATGAEVLLVVDHGSTDDTAEVAARAGAQVLPGEGTFAQLRARATEAACTEWILFIDADERLAPGAIGRLHALVAAHPRVAGFRLPILSHLGERPLRWGGYAPARRLRLLRRDAARWPPASVHERAVVTGPVRRGDETILHHGYRDRAHARAKLERYAALSAVDLRTLGRRPGHVEVALRAGWRLVRVALLRGGWLMGRDGWWLAAEQARAVWLRGRWARRGPPAALVAPPDDPHGTGGADGRFACDPPHLRD